MRTVILVVFDDLQLLDLAGPVDVLAGATEMGADPPYRTLLTSVDGRPVRGSGVEIGVDASLDQLSRRRRAHSPRRRPPTTITRSGSWDPPISWTRRFCPPDRHAAVEERLRHLAGRRPGCPGDLRRIPHLGLGLRRSATQQHGQLAQRQPADGRVPWNPPGRTRPLTRDVPRRAVPVPALRRWADSGSSVSGRPRLWPDTDYGGNDDAAIIWFDPTVSGKDEVGNQGVGLYRCAKGSQRYTLGQFPDTVQDAGLFDDASSVTIFDQVPPSDQTPDYPPPH
jgi:hypothetical protein